MYEVRAILADFACSAKSGSPQCVTARVTMLEQGDKIAEQNESDLRTVSIVDDVRRRERKNLNDAERFGSEDWLRSVEVRSARS